MSEETTTNTEQPIERKLEETNPEETQPEESKPEEPKQEEPKQEEPKQEEPKQEEPNTEEHKKDEEPHTPSKATEEKRAKGEIDEGTSTPVAQAAEQLRKLEAERKLRLEQERLEAEKNRTVNT